MNTKNKRIPVSIITGFLESGKTSFINNIIKKNKGVNIAIIENEFGEISIDKELIQGVEQDQIYNITNGCICCSLKTEFVELLDNYLNTFKRFNHLIIETSGIANPASIILPFYNNYGLQLNCKLHNVICIIDAANFEKSFKDFNYLEHQIAISDVIIINKSENFL